MSLLLLALACGSANIALAQAPGPGSSVPGTPGFTFTFDEAGTSLLNGGPNPLPVVPIPGGGIQYFLPVPVIPGDVLVKGSSDISTIAYTDLVINPVDATKVTSAAHPFGLQDVGGTLLITGGTGFTIQVATIASVSGNVATLGAAAGTVGATGGVSQLTTVGISDLLSFTNNTANQGILSYFSLIDDSSPPDLADVSAFNVNTPFSVTEFGPEGLNQLQWIPDPNNPFGAIYNGVSDGVVPEPSTFVLGGLGLIALFLIGRRRRSPP